MPPGNSCPAFTSSVASYCDHAARYAPRYPVNAFMPHGLCFGAAIGANADIDRYFCGFLRPMVSAPCPPIEWPMMPLRVDVRRKLAAMIAGSSSTT